MYNIKFREIRINDAERILNWRTKERITRYMGSDINVSVKEQKEWIDDCYNKDDYYHWMVTTNNIDIGTICIKNINLENNSTSWGFYIGDDNYLGYGGFIPPHFYNWVFNNLNLNEIKAYVFEDLKNVIGLHKTHGYEYINKENKLIIKNNRQIKVIAMTLKKEYWNFKRYKNFSSPFPITKWKNSLRVTKK